MTPTHRPSHEEIAAIVRQAHQDRAAAFARVIAGLGKWLARRRRPATAAAH